MSYSARYCPLAVNTSVWLVRSVLTMELDEYLEQAEGLLGISPTAKTTSVQLTPR